MICVATSPGERRVAVLQDGALLDYAIDRPGAPDGVGDLHIGRILAQVPAMAGAFVALDGAEGFLADSQGAKGRTAGTLLAVKITRAAQGGKGPRLTARLEDAPPAETVGLLARGPDAIARFARAHPHAPIHIDDAGVAATLRPAFGPRVTIVRQAFTPDLEDRIAALAEPRTTLPGGASLHIAPTPALTAIDVDAGSATATRAEKSAAQAELNRSLLPAVASEIRLRNLSGAILIDLAGMKARRRPTLLADIGAALADDPLRPRLLGITALGFVEILRPRIHPPLHERLAGPYAAALAALRDLTLTASGSAAILAAPCLTAGPALITALESDRCAREEFTARTGQKLRLRADPTLPAHRWTLDAAP